MIPRLFPSGSNRHALEERLRTSPVVVLTGPRQAGKTTQALEVGPEGEEVLWLRGGFPESFLAPDDRTSLRWRQDFLRAYVEREILLLGGRLFRETLCCLADLEALPGVPPGPGGPTCTWPT